MESIRKLLIVSVAIFCAPVLAQPPSLAHFESIHDWHTAERTAADAGDAAALTAAFSAFGRQFEMAMEPNRRIQAQTRTPGSRARALLGGLRDNSESWARIVISEAGAPAGLIWDGETLYGIEPSGTGSQAVIFRADDLIIPAGTMSCGMHGPARDAAAMFAELASHEPQIARAAGATLSMGLGLVADAEFTALYPDAADAMLVRANNVDGIYSEQLGLQLTVGATDVFSETDVDPFSDTTVSDILLEELSHFRGDTPTQHAQGLTHLFTGRNLDGSTVGIAYLNSVCSELWPDGRSIGVSLTQANFGLGAAFLESLIAAHEIGHNFGAPHDGEAGQCADAPADHIMAPSLSPTADTFSQCSIDVMTANLPSTTCLTPIANVDLAIQGQSSVSAPLTETQFNYVVTVTNQGLETAAEASADLVFDPSLAVLAATPQSGTCGPAQANLSCDLGPIPGGSSRTIAVILRADLAGEARVSGTVASSHDTSTINNSFGDSITVVPASDLALESNPQTLNLDESAEVAVTLENRSRTDASSIALTGSWSDGLQASDAAFAGEACELNGAARTLSCQISSLAGFSSGKLVLTMSGIETGSQSLTVNVSALESDPDTTNNSSIVALEITGRPAPQPSQPAAEAGGGGGSLGPLALLALLGAWRRRLARSGNANFS